MKVAIWCKTLLNVNSTEYVLGVSRPKLMHYSFAYSFHLISKFKDLTRHFKIGVPEGYSRVAVPYSNSNLH